MITTSKKLIAILLIICSSSVHAELVYNPEDPYADINRLNFYLNHTVFALYIKPATKVYDLLPLPVKEGANNFIQNIRMVPYTINSFLQGKIEQTFQNALRFILNTTLGMAGLFDVALEFGVPERKETLGDTFYAWGWKESAYLVVPLVGPSTIRDAWGLGGDYFMAPSAYFQPDWWNPYYLLVLVNTNYLAKDIQTLVSIAGVNDYDFVRSSFLQNRHYELTGETLGASPTGELSGPPE